jgi:hypothetical protein
VRTVPYLVFHGNCEEALSHGATVTMPVEEQFWGAVYGSLIDTAAWTSQNDRSRNEEMGNCGRYRCYTQRDSIE